MVRASTQKRKRIKVMVEIDITPRMARGYAINYGTMMMSTGQWRNQMSLRQFLNQF